MSDIESFLNYPYLNGSETNRDNLNSEDKKQKKMLILTLDIF